MSVEWGYEYKGCYIRRMSDGMFFVYEDEDDDVPLAAFMSQDDAEDFV